MRVTIEFNGPRPRRWRRRGWAALGLVVALVVPAGVLASHQFTDVPTDHPFHRDIGEAYETRITAGCTASTFCPDSPVTRGQMTAFLNRGLGRVVHASLSGVLTSSTDVTLGTVTIRAGNVAGGSARVFVSATVNAYSTAAGCPCEIRLDLHDQAGFDVSSFIVVDLPAIPAGDDDTDVSLAIQGTATVPTGVDRTFSVVARRTFGTATLVPYGALDAIYVPFDGTGGGGAMVSGAGVDSVDNGRD